MRRKLYSLINIIGLSVSLTTCIFILIWVLHETSYDKFHKNIDRIYRVNLRDVTYDKTRNYVSTPPALAKELLKDIPEIEYAVTYDNTKMPIRYEDKKLNANVGFSSEGFFDIFTFPLIEGDTQGFFDTPYSVMLTLDMAEKLFNEGDPIGKSISLNNKHEFTVVGLIKNIPESSTLDFEILTSFSNREELTGEGNVESWNTWGYNTFITLTEHADNQSLENKIVDFAQKKATFSWTPELYLQPLDEIHLYDINGGGQIIYVTMFSLIAIFVLIIACINFINLSTAQSTLRIKEIGLRKIVGASKKKLIIQILTESFIMVFLSILLSLVFLEVLSPVFGNFTGLETSQRYLFSNTFILLLAGICIIVGFLSGLYPAFYLSSIHPIRAFKPSPKSSSSALRKILIVFQFAISIFLIIGTIVVLRQVRFLRKQQLGFNMEHILYIPMNDDIYEKYSSIKDKLLQNPNIMHTTLTSDKIGTRSLGCLDLNEWEGNTGDQQLLVDILSVHYDFLETFGIEMVEGRFFSRDITSNEVGPIFNETAIKAMGLENPIGTRTLDNYPILGVIKDFNFESLHSEIQPLVILLQPAWLSYVALKLRGQELPSTLRYIEDTFHEFSPDFQFEYQFADEAFDELYRSEQRMGVMFGIFSFIAIVLSSLGLFALSLFMVQRRLKEIGIRKVLGSSVKNIVFQLSTAFVKWVIVAFLITTPLAYFFLHKWLINFAYKIPLSFWIFALAGGITLFIALLTVSLQSIKGANANPVEVLRNE